MPKYKATINIDREFWDKYKNYCQEGLGVSVSERIRDLLYKDMGGKITLTLESDSPSEFARLSESQIAQLKIDFFDSLNQRLSKIEARLDGLETDGKTDTLDGLETDTLDGLETDLKPISEQLTGIKVADTDDTDDTDKGTELADTDSTDDTDSQGELADTDDMDDTDELNTDLADYSQLTYSDKEVFDLEPSIKSKTTVYRYRKGTSRPKDATFLDRWQVSPSGLKWMKVEKKDNFGGFNEETQ